MAHKIYETHAGAVTGIAPSPFHYYVAVITDIGEFIVYNSILKTLVLKKWFKIGCTAILWLPFEVFFRKFMSAYFDFLYFLFPYSKRRYYNRADL